MSRQPEEFRIVGRDGTTLEARWDAPVSPTAAIVFCHPHPEYGGTMRAPLMGTVTETLVRKGVAVLRFNFRGVGSSGSRHPLDFSEMEDVGTAMEGAVSRYPSLRVSVAGWSFGAAAALSWQAFTGSTVPYVGIAPPVTSESTPPLPPPPTWSRRVGSSSWATAIGWSHSTS